MTKLENSTAMALMEGKGKKNMVYKLNSVNHIILNQVTETVLWKYGNV